MTTTPKSTRAISTTNPVVARPYVVGIFDVLGFKNTFEKLGLREITARYAMLIDIVVKKDEHLAEMKTYFPHMKEGPYWCAGGEIAVMTKVYAAYASDTFLIWANYTWNDLHEGEKSELERFAKDPNHDWLFRPVPCDAFLDTCNELMCRSLQVGLPLRGAVAVGDAILDKERNIFLGQPIIEANDLERDQRFIGAGMCSSFINQTIPKRFSVSFNRQLKDSTKETSGLILDWPRHWRDTRSIDARKVIESMNTDAKFSEYYVNTLASIEQSEKYAKDYAPSNGCPIRNNYEQFSYSRQGNIAAQVMPVCRVKLEESAKLTQTAAKSTVDAEGSASSGPAA
ncbi:MAG: hypothetical protein ISP90_01815 [Nevskia sp.]|nr:hypothetical protein [Nevskia sp.]